MRKNRLRLIAAAVALSLTLAGCGEFLLVNVLDGDSGESLTLTPDSLVMAVGASVEFIANGGYPPYDFTIDSGSGEIDSSTGVYVAPSMDGSAVVTVTDAVGTKRSANVQITVPTTLSIDYDIVNLTWISGDIAGQSVNGTFEITNVGRDPGNHSISWQVYASLDTSADPSSDILLDVGSTGPLDPDQSSGPIAFNGNWPPLADFYYLVVLISTAPDDPLTSNNTEADAGTNVSMPPALDIDYVPSIITPIANPVTSGDPISESFEVVNNLSQDGSSQIFWQAYVSKDGVVDSNDDLIDAGSIDPPPAGFSSGAIAVNSGSWPTVGSSTTYRLLVVVQATDEPTANNANNLASAPTTVNRPLVDYSVDFVTNSATPTSTSAAISESLQIRNGGSQAGTQTVVWEARISTDTVFGTSDIFAAAGTIDPLGPGTNTGSIQISGFWPSNSGEYHLVVSVSASDDVNVTNNYGSSGIIQVNAPAVDYTVSSITYVFPTVPGGSSVSESFVYRNSGNTSGTSTVGYRAFVSDDNVLDDPGDTLIADVDLGSGSWLGAQSSSPSIPIDGFWPDVQGAYYLIIDVDSTDNSNQDNDHLVAGPFEIVGPPEYEVSLVGFPVLQYGGNPGESMSVASSSHGGPAQHAFRIDELNGSDGLQDITWHVYQSDNPSLDAGDIILQESTTPRLEAGTSKTFTVDYPLPGAVGDWFYIVTITAGDDESTDNNSITIGPVQVWTPANNLEIDEPPDDDYFAIQAQNFHAILNPGDIFNYTGYKDPQDYQDKFLFRTGPSTTQVQIRATWTANQDSLDFQLFSETAPPPLGPPIDYSIDIGLGEEPAGGGYWVIPGLAPNTLYFMDAYSLTPAFVGDPYWVEIIAGP